MAEPRILDRGGNPLSVGDRVERNALSGKWVTDTVRRIGWGRRRGWVIKTDAMPHVPTWPADDPNTFTCPDLQKVPTKEAVTAASERSTA